jgi:hypothetical protein
MDTKHIPSQPAIYALVRLHAELGGKIKDNKREAIKLRENMKHVEAVLHLLDPEFNARSIAPRRRYNPNPLFKRGHVFRAVLNTLREAPGPMTAPEIADALFRMKGVKEPTKQQSEHLYGAVAAALRLNQGKTVIGDEGRPRRWRVL